MEKNLRKVKTYLDILYKRRKCNQRKIENIKILPCGYKTDNILPPLNLFKDFKYGDRWGEINGHAWFYFNVEANNDHTYLFIRTDFTGWDATRPQFILYINGKMIQGLDINHLDALLTEGKNEIYLYGYTGYEIEQTQLFADVYELDAQVDGLYYDIKYPYDVLSFADSESEEYAHILKHLNNAVSVLDLYDLNSPEFTLSVDKAREYLKNEYYAKYCREQPATVACIGHTHIDCAWLWTLEQTKEKVQRSFSTVLELMKRYPDYKFMSSQALLYKYYKEEAPEKYEELKQRVKEGRWEVEGSMFVEADCNLSSGESLIRQIIRGKSFFKKEFGVETKILWLPDVFGYCAALPQILKKCNVEWFLTSKISWNDTNRMPYDTFMWKGMDGSEIKSYFLTAQNDTGKPSVNYAVYVGETNAKMIAGTYKRYQQKNLSDKVLLTFGHGDGGGGPTIAHLEYLSRGYNGVPSLPNARSEFAGEFLSELSEKIKDNPDMPKWQGELYLEYHRGTYTTQVNNKKNNRKCEFLLSNTELLSCIAERLFKIEYHFREIDACWEKLLINQFHDIIPGSSIKEVYERSGKDYAEIYRDLSAINDAVFETLARKVGKGEYLVFNPTSFGGDKVVKLNGKSVLVKGVAEKGFSIVKEIVSNNGILIDNNTVETNVYKVVFNEKWEISSVYDKTVGREILKGTGNEFRLYADYPDDYDAWEWQEHSLDKFKIIDSVSDVSFKEDGVRKGICITRKFSRSEIGQTIWFYDNLNRIDFETTVDWHEKHNMLKVAFPVDINTDKATYDVQFGNVERATHYNTTWDKAKFEVCAHKFADLSEGGYGVSLLNDCKYGYGIHDGTIQLSLLRAPIYPDETADMGTSSFTYSVCTHSGTFKDSNTVIQAYDLNNPSVILEGKGEKTGLEEYSFIKTDCANVICETVKKEEVGDGYIVRLYETMNKRCNCKITLGETFFKAYLCDMLENDIKELEIRDNEIIYDFRGFEIATVKLLKKM